MQNYDDPLDPLKKKPNWWEMADPATYDAGIPSSPGDATSAQTSDPGGGGSTWGDSDYFGRYPSIVDAYTTYLGRSPSAAEIASQTGGGTFSAIDPRLQYSISNIQNSPEALSYRNKTATTTQSPVDASYSPTALAGWDQTKWADTTHTTPKYKIGRLLSTMGASAANLQALLPQIQALYPGTTLVGADTLNIPGVGLVDVGGNFNDAVTGNESWWWGPESDTTGTQNVTSSSDVSGTGTSALSASSGSSTSGSGGGSSNAVWSKILELMNQSPVDVTTDPAYSKAIQAYGVQQQRATERERNAIAERMAAAGSANSGAFDSQVLAAEQARGENQASFVGDLSLQALQQQRDEILQALQIGAGLLSDEQRIALSERLGLINASLEQQSITNQNNQFTSQLGWDMATWPSSQAAAFWNLISGQ